MGLRLSKAATSFTGSKSSKAVRDNNTSNSTAPSPSPSVASTCSTKSGPGHRSTSARTQQPQQQRRSSARVPIPALVGPTINLQIQESPTTAGHTPAPAASPLSQSSSGSLASVNTSCAARQIIIKIQLAKMENGNEVPSTSTATATPAATPPEGVVECSTVVDANCNQRDAQTQILNVTLNRGSPPLAAYRSRHTHQHHHHHNISMSSSNNNGRHCGEQDELEQSGGSSESAEYCEVLEGATAAPPPEEDETCSAASETEGKNTCCRRRVKSGASAAGVGDAAYTLKRRCCKCTCRDAFRRILEPSTSKSSRKEHKDSKHSNAREQTATLASTPAGGETPASQVAIWAPSGSDVRIPFNASSQFVVVQCPPTSMVTLEGIDDAIRAICLVNADFEGGPPATAVPAPLNSTPAPDVPAVAEVVEASTALPPPSVEPAPPSGPIVHSQVDFVHCLVPDLERITNSSFYWGKMDRYEAERLLDGKPEGTFLLRDSAQEEYLFSVTFRKYGRSLHARIEQYGHKFSFDCHDPCVFTAPTVTGLLQHYKDPTCVMFFEPMLTIPLHRRTTFSLQQLCRATIVSNTTYDGVTELELPPRLKAYLKEYHYKQKLRVKPFDEPFYACT